MININKEIQGNGEDVDKNEVFSKYEEAFNKSIELHKYIDKHAKYAAGLKRKTIGERIFAWLGWGIGIISGLVTIWQFWGENIKDFLASLFK